MHKRSPINLMRITAPHYCAGAALGSDGRVFDSAPILWGFIGQHRAQLEKYCLHRGYHWEYLRQSATGWRISAEWD